MEEGSSEICSGSTAGQTKEPMGGGALADQLARALKNLQIQPQQHSYHTITISTKLSQFSYSLWARLIRMAIGSRGQLSHITGIPAPPEKHSPEYTQWEQTDLMVCSWMLENMESDLIANFAE